MGEQTPMDVNVVVNTFYSVQGSNVNLSSTKAVMLRDPAKLNDLWADLTQAVRNVCEKYK